MTHVVEPKSTRARQSNKAVHAPGEYCTGTVTFNLNPGKDCSSFEGLVVKPFLTPTICVKKIILYLLCCTKATVYRVSGVKFNLCTSFQVRFSIQMVPHNVTDYKSKMSFLRKNHKNHNQRESSDFHHIPTIQPIYDIGI